MSQFKIGDRVKYIGPDPAYYGRIFTIASKPNEINQYSVKEVRTFRPYKYNVIHVTPLEELL